MRQRGLDIPEELPITWYANAALFHRDLERDVAVIGVCNCLNMSAGAVSLYPMIDLTLVRQRHVDG